MAYDEPSETAEAVAERLAMLADDARETGPPAPLPAPDLNEFDNFWNQCGTL